MSDPQIKRIEQLFQQAADLTVDERRELLERECTAEPAIRQRVELLLEQLDRNETLDSPAAALASARVTEGAGTQIGRYRLLLTANQLWSSYPSDGGY